MPVSLHLARFTPRAAGRMLRRRERFLGPAPGLGTASLCVLAELEPVTGGIPRPLRWGLLCGWETDAARDEWCAGGAERFTRGAHEAWGVALETVRTSRGEMPAVAPPAGEVERLGRSEPLAVLTHGRLRARHTVAFTVNNRRVVRAMTGNPGLGMMVGLADTPQARTTFSVWRSQGDAVRFAYGTDSVHKPIQRRALDAPWADGFFFARFRLAGATGTWEGRDPLAALAAQPEEET